MDHMKDYCTTVSAIPKYFASYYLPILNRLTVKNAANHTLIIADGAVNVCGISKKFFDFDLKIFAVYL